MLPRLLALGPAGRAVWVVYGLVPLLLVPTALGVAAIGRHDRPQLARAALVLAVLSAFAMALGLLRWPSLHWQLAIAHTDATPVAREAIAAVFSAANSYLGQVIGEFLGELFLNAFFACAALVLAGAGAAPQRWLAPAGLAASLLGAVAMLRNAVPGLDMVAALNNAVLPLWMLVMGVAMLRHRARPAPASAASLACAPVPGGQSGAAARRPYSEQDTAALRGAAKLA